MQIYKHKIFNFVPCTSKVKYEKDKFVSSYRWGGGENTQKAVEREKANKEVFFVAFCGSFFVCAIFDANLINYLRRNGEFISWETVG